MQCLKIDIQNYLVFLEPLISELIILVDIGPILTINNAITIRIINIIIIIERYIYKCSITLMLECIFGKILKATFLYWVRWTNRLFVQSVRYSSILEGLKFDEISSVILRLIIILSINPRTAD